MTGFCTGNERMSVSRQQRYVLYVGTIPTSTVCRKKTSRQISPKVNSNIVYSKSPANHRLSCYIEKKKKKRIEIKHIMKEPEDLAQSLLLNICGQLQ
jgi:hypothetical protein